MTDLDLDDLPIEHPEKFERSTIAKLYYEHLRGHIWHTTTLAQSDEIRRSGLLNANDGSWPYTYGVKQSYGGNRGYVCLFDLRDVMEQELQRHYWKWAKLFENPGRVALRLDCDAPSSHLIPNDRPTHERVFNEMLIPGVEAWYPKPIPTAAVVARLSRQDNGSFALVAERFPTDELKRTVKAAAATQGSPASSRGSGGGERI